MQFVFLLTLIFAGLVFKNQRQAESGTQGSVTMNAEAAISSIKEVPSSTQEGNKEAKVNLASLSEMTGFPVDFIKSELLVEENEMTLTQLRASMAEYLEKTNLEMRTEL